ncbi:ATP-binding protein [Paenibacillus sp. FSL H8-0537]|uniref:AAA family ATPase n=1 Tax=Paenibacillus sp. FSL H8-0537 TaxID=2921399 RepID=UPI003100E4DC
MLEVSFKNLGSIKNGTVKLNKLTILAGENNTGKTYASYAIYGLLKHLANVKVTYPALEAADLNDKGEIKVDFSDFLNSYDELVATINKEFSADLYQIFSTSQNAFQKSFVEVDIDKDLFIKYMNKMGYEHSTTFGKAQFSFELKKEPGSSVAYIYYFYKGEYEPSKVSLLKKIIESILDDIVFEPFKKDVFILPAERSGLNLFYKELNANRNELVHKIGIDMLNDPEQLKLQVEKFITPYSTPISDYITFLNRLERRSQVESEFKDLANELQNNVIKGSYSIENQNIVYQPLSAKGKSSKPKNEGIQLHVASSTAKTLFGLVFYLNYMAKEGQTLIIDEPELNLHPDNQRKMARILAKLANRGINVLISTHSDYIIKEFNNLLMLGKEFPDKIELMKKYKYSESEILKQEDISPYVFIDSKIKPMEIDDLEGIIAETFDDVINQYNDSVDEIYLAIREGLEN